MPGGNFSKKKFCVSRSLSNISKNGLRMVVHLNFDITHLSPPSTAECFCWPYGSPASVITPFVKANFGNWGEWQHCPEGGYVVGMRMKKEGYQGIECQQTFGKKISTC